MSTTRARRPLDSQAVSEADRRLWEAHPELHGRKLTLGAEDAALREEWWRYYFEAKGGGDKPVNPKPPDRPADPCAATKLNIKLFSVRFRSDHGLLTDYLTDYKRTGTRFEEQDKREWTIDHSFPISHTKNRKIKLTVEFDVTPAGGTPGEGTVTGDGGADYLRFKGKALFSPGRVSVDLTADAALPDEVVKLDKRTITWRVACPDSSVVAGVSGEHTVYVTYDRPIVQGKTEDGVTWRRMEKAVDLVGEAWKAGRHRPVRIVDYIFSRFEGYTLGFEYLSDRQQRYLRDHPDERRKLEEVDFAAYFNDEKGGAWPLGDRMDYGGECQAIVRFTRGAIHQVGVPGKAEQVLITADASDPFTAREGSEPTGPKADRGYALVDAKVRFGETYGDKDLNSEGVKVGWNNFEAYLVFTDDQSGDEDWFGGGVGHLDASQDPLYVFYGLAEYKLVSRRGVLKRKVTRVWVYEGRNGTLVGEHRLARLRSRP